MSDNMAIQLSKFDPLSRIIYFDDFDTGLNGWTGLIGNYEDTLDSILPGFRDLRPPMLSSAGFWDTGSAGSFDGTYAMKLATRPRAESLSVGIKRITFRGNGPLRLEAYFTFKPEAEKLRLSDTDAGSIGFLFDLQDDKHRVMPHVRYLNAHNGERVQKWQFKRERVPIRDVGGTGETVSHFHLSADGWEDIPGGDQKLCYNEIATKQNWHYLRVGFDLDTMAFTEFQCNDQAFVVDSMAPMVMPAMPNLWCMLNAAFWSEAGSDRRTMLYVDSVLLSGEF